MTNFSDSAILWQVFLPSALGAPDTNPEIDWQEANMQTPDIMQLPLTPPANVLRRRSTHARRRSTHTRRRSTHARRRPGERRDRRERIQLHSPRTLADLIPWLDHAIRLANALSLGPIFHSYSHGYDTIDLSHRPATGFHAGFRDLVAAAHQRGMKIILMAFSITWIRHAMVQSLREGPDSKYADLPVTKLGMVGRLANCPNTLL